MTAPLRPPTPHLDGRRHRTEATSEKYRLLVVDDHREARILVDRMLRALCEVEPAVDGNEAMRLLGEQDYDVVLLDIQLPGSFNGVKVLQQIRKHFPDLDAPIIAFTAHALPGDAERLLSLGFDGYIGKPFTRNELIDAVRGSLG
jgi:CheY-like chemotaxis protein